MATAAEVDLYRKAQNGLVKMAVAELDAFWRTLDITDPVAAARALEAFLPALVRAYGEIGAAVAADFYDDLRAGSAGARGVYTATMGDAVDLTAVRKSTGWAVQPLFIPEPDAAATLARVIQITDRFVKQPGRSTINTNVQRDPAQARYARVPSGATTCAFCLALASRGPVYATEETAGGSYHADCDCVPTPVWDGDPLPKGYDPDALFAKYRDARDAAETGSLKGSDGILATLRKQEGIR